MPSVASSSGTRAGDLSTAATFASDAEFRFLLAAVRKPEEISGELEEQAKSPLDWQRALRLAEHHGVMPPLYQTLCGVSKVIPQGILDELRERYENNARRNLVFVTELIRVLDCLEAHGIDAIPYKGPLLAEQVYGDLALREFSDLDILVRPADVARATEALKSLSYAPNLRLSRLQQRAYVRSGYECAFDGPLGKNLLEMQWAIVPRFFSVNFGVEEFFEHATFSEIGGRPVRTLSTEDLLLALCVHGAKHAWMRLCWLRDIAAVVQLPQLDWHRVWTKAKELGVVRILGVSLTLAHCMAGASVPRDAREQVQTDAMIQELSDRIALHIPESEEYSTEALEYFRLMMSLRERASDRIRFTTRLAFTPSVGEWAVIGLPGPLFPLYRVVRLFRLAGRLLSPGSN